MGRYVLRRLLWAVPTLIGICVVTFAMIHLAPGDPVTGGSAGGAGLTLRREQADSARRLFFLDLPLFYNPRPRGLLGRVERLLQQLQRDPQTGQRALARCGTVCVTPLLERHSSAETSAARALALRALAAVRGGVGAAGQGSDPTAEPVAALSWGRKQQQRVRRALGPLVHALGSGRDVEQRLSALGTAALAGVMPVLLDGDGARQQGASRVASAITGIRGQIDTRTTATDRAHRLVRWHEWWFQHRRDFQRFSRWQRISGRLAETQFAKWLSRLVTLRFGHSTRDGRPVLEKLAEALPVTMTLSFISMLLAYLVAVPLGVHAAVRRGSLLERCTTLVLFLLYSLPPYWVAMVLILLLGGVGWWDLFPIHGLSSDGMELATGWPWLVDRIHHLVLPVFCLTYASVAVISRYQRSAMLEVIRQDYIRTARAKGLSERAVILRHGLRNALLPVITLAGLQLPYLISGSVIVERIFNIPGMGLMTFEAFLNRDYPVIMAVAVLSAVLTLAGLILADVCYAWADPRIKQEGGLSR